MHRANLIVMRNQAIRIAALRQGLVLGICATGIAVVGCAAQKTAGIARDVPAGFENDAAAPGEKWPAQGWYREFSSDELNAFIDQAALQNEDLAGARARVTQADARARQAGAAILPSVDAAGNANYLAGHSSQGGGHELDWSAMLTASYEVDFWGKNRAIADSALRLADAARAERDTVALTTLAGVAGGYFRVMALDERLAIARSNRDAALQVLAVVQARFDAGAAGLVELAAQKSAVDTAEVAITDLEPQAGEALAALALLLGRFPEGFRVVGGSLDALHEPLLGPGLPSELLTRRPDLRLAEANLQAAHADLLVARAAMLPSLSLTAGAGVQNPALPAIVLTIPGIGPSFALGGSLLQPIFDRGRLRAQRDEAVAKEVELLTVYRAAIIAAFGDVENALRAAQQSQKSMQFELDNVAQSERAFTGAKLRYESGSGDFLILLAVQQSLYSARDRLVQAKLGRLESLVGLCKALGGGWAQPAASAMR